MLRALRSTPPPLIAWARVDAQVLANRLAMPGETPRNHLTKASSNLWHTEGVRLAGDARTLAHLLWLAADILEGAA